ncbi:MAG: ArsA family ATPase [Aphanocapsa sp. GSE-SYN-MK-11-07L]|jgi:arsenite-transporting ATPase|nr:ArsA family ATPase [Aphanocapsa sp. GSE-SYN-MK-11-07L]
MSRIITFLGAAGSQQTTVAIAVAKWFVQQNQSVLFVTHAPNPAADLLLETPLTAHPQTVIPGLDAVQLQSTVLLEDAWKDLKHLIAPYLPNSFSEEIYALELMILPGVDSLLAFNALRQYYASGQYAAVIYQGQSDLDTLRMIGVPESLDWYFRRFHQMFDSLDVGKIADSLGGPIASAIISANIDSQKIRQGLDQVRDWIAQGLAVMNNPERLTAYLLTEDDPAAIAQARWLWGSAQQVNLRVSGVFADQAASYQLSTLLKSAFDPLAIHPLPPLKQDWQPLLDALPNFDHLPLIPQPLAIDLIERQVHVFLPGFTKQQVKLTQLGSALTIEAGNQRRNIALPLELSGKPLTGGKFEEPYLVISFD